MKQIIFRKLYVKMTEKDYGQAFSAIITFEKIPFMYNTQDMGNGQYRSVTIQYQYYLCIDLWFIVLRYQWKSKLLKVAQTNK